jgi:hypothetical protein
MTAVNAALVVRSFDKFRINWARGEAAFVARIDPLDRSVPTGSLLTTMRAA